MTRSPSRKPGSALFQRREAFAREGAIAQLAIRLHGGPVEVAPRGHHQPHLLRPAHEGFRLIGGVLGVPRLDSVDPHSVEIGDNVRVVFTQVADDVWLPQWVQG